MQESGKYFNQFSTVIDADTPSKSLNKSSLDLIIPVRLLYYRYTNYLFFKYK